MTSHPRFDLDRFLAMFPLPALREEARARRAATPAPPPLLGKGLVFDWVRSVEAATKNRPPPIDGPGGEIITTPYDMAVVEQVRREALGASPPADAVPADVFVFGSGEPPAPYLTKLGGVPFRSAKKPWPTTDDGRPQAFLAQLCFIDSRDLVRETPGDVLLVFGDATKLHALGPRNSHLEWVSLEEPDLLSSAEVPEVWVKGRPTREQRAKGEVPGPQRFAVFPAFGVIHRTFDLGADDPRLRPYRRPFLLGALQATKIGGVPHFVQDAPGSNPGSFLAAITSAQPHPEKPYPWINRSEPYTGREIHGLGALMFGDMGNLSIFLDARGQLQLIDDSY